MENLWRYTKMGFDLVAFSGGKGLRGPQSAGLLLGRKDLIEAARLNNSPNGDTLCRTNKVNKEEIIGMLVALETFLKRGPRRDLEGLGSPLPRASPRPIRLPGRQDRGPRPRDRQRRPAPAVTWDEKQAGRDARATDQEAARGLAQHRGLTRLGDAARIGVWMMEPGEDAIVGERLRAILAGA